MQTIFAATVQQQLGIGVAILMLVGWLIYIVVALRARRADQPLGAEIELAPNRKPYLDDEGLEGRRLERVLGWALLLLMLVSIGPLLYWLREPSRQVGAERGFDQRAVKRGFSLFQPTDSPEHGAHFGCAECHGSVGQGGVANYVIADPDGSNRTVQWVAPPLDTVLLRFSAEEVRTILVYGRANTPMPAWGVLGGGPMNDQQIDDLIAYMQSIQLTPEEARERSTEEAVAEAKRLGKSASDGEVLFGLNCARCHTKGWSYGEPDVQGGGAFGPNLTNGDAIRQFPEPETLIEFLTIGSEFAKPYGERGVGSGRMPGFGNQLTEAQIKAIADYVRSL